MPYHRTGRRQSGCPFCAGQAACTCNSLQALYPDIAAQWDYSKNEGQPSDFPGSSSYLAWWSSPQRGSWQQFIKSRTSQEQQRTARHLLRLQQRQKQKSASQDCFIFRIPHHPSPMCRLVSPLSVQSLGFALALWYTPECMLQHD